MIAADQPTCFPDTVLVAVSSKTDGTMLDRAMGVHDGTIVSNRTKFCDLIGIDYGNVVYQRIIYADDASYALITDAHRESTTSVVSEVIGDAIYTTTPGIAIMLPVADCVATVIYDPIRQAICTAHLGRHSSYAKLATHVVARFVAGGSRPENLVVWMSPNASKKSYRLDWFDRTADPDWAGYYEQKDDGVAIDLAGFNQNLFEKSGVLSANIHASPVDTMTDDNYFSHRTGDTGGRIVVVAGLR